MSDHIITERQGAVHIIRFNRADKKNALTRAMYASLAAALKESDENDEIAVSVFLGQPESFTSGNDIADFMAVATGAEKGMEVIDFLRALISSEKPMIAGVDGPAVGIGTTMLFHCDQVFASPRAVFATPFVDLGVVPEGASSLLAPRTMGYQAAFRLLALAERFGPQEANAAGFVTEITSNDDLESRALQAAEVIASKPREAMKLARKLLRGDRAEVTERMENEGRIFAERLVSDEARNAFISFMNRSKPA
ncbi:MAG: crotonase/enoyl-CoA hydratase family protein [Pseudomonadota bacterium]